MSKETEMILDAIKNLQIEMVSTKTELQKEIASTKTELQGEMTALKEEMTSTKTELQGEMTALKEEMTSTKTELQNEISALKNEVTSIKVTLENVTNRNIKVIAEGHLDLCKKLDKAIEVNNEKELLLVRVNLLEDEVRRLKEQFNTIA